MKTPPFCKNTPAGFSLTDVDRGLRLIPYQFTPKLSFRQGIFTKKLPLSKAEAAYLACFFRYLPGFFPVFPSDYTNFNKFSSSKRPIIGILLKSTKNYYFFIDFTHVLAYNV
jgi:hypothetical protein